LIEIGQRPLDQGPERPGVVLSEDGVHDELRLAVVDL
jgi:hypothetical protein